MCLHLNGKCSWCKARLYSTMADSICRYNRKLGSVCRWTAMHAYKMVRLTWAAELPPSSTRNGTLKHVLHIRIRLCAMRWMYSCFDGVPYPSPVYQLAFYIIQCSSIFYTYYYSTIQWNRYNSRSRASMAYAGHIIVGVERNRKHVYFYLNASFCLLFCMK